MAIRVLRSNFKKYVKDARAISNYNEAKQLNRAQPHLLQGDKDAVNAVKLDMAV